MLLKEFISLSLSLVYRTFHEIYAIKFVDISLLYVFFFFCSFAPRYEHVLKEENDDGSVKLCVCRC